MKFVQSLILVAIWLLLSLLGIAVGANENIMENLSTIGWQALILALGAVGGSVILVWVVYKFFFFRKNTGLCLAWRKGSYVGDGNYCKIIRKRVCCGVCFSWNGG